jgi:hypothetical protein
MYMFNIPQCKEIKTMVQGKTVSRFKILVIASAAMALLSFGIVFAQYQRSGGTNGPSQDRLRPGTYTAKVKAIVCEGCGPLIQKTLQSFKELAAVTVNQENRTVQFSVKKNNMTNVSVLQKALDAAAKRMGMGADYTLSNLKRK